MESQKVVLILLELRQLEKEKQILKCRLCDSKIDVNEVNQHHQICLKNSLIKKKILYLDQELVNLINESVKQRNKYSNELNLLKQNKLLNEILNSKIFLINLESNNISKQRIMLLNKKTMDQIAYQNKKQQKQLNKKCSKFGSMVMYQKNLLVMVRKLQMQMNKHQILEICQIDINFIEYKLRKLNQIFAEKEFIEKFDYELRFLFHFQEFSKHTIKMNQQSISKCVLDLKNS